VHVALQSSDAREQLGVPFNDDFFCQRLSDSGGPTAAAAAVERLASGGGRFSDGVAAPRPRRLEFRFRSVAVDVTSSSAATTSTSVLDAVDDDRSFLLSFTNSKSMS